MNELLAALDKAARHIADESPEAAGRIKKLADNIYYREKRKQILGLRYGREAIPQTK